MASRDELISLEDISFDDSGRVVISKPTTVARLKAASSASAIKNIGCCSVDEPQAVAEGVATSAASRAIKNIGCCSVDEPQAVAASAGSRAIKNIGCCSVDEPQ